MGRRPARPALARVALTAAAAAAGVALTAAASLTATPRIGTAPAPAVTGLWQGPDVLGAQDGANVTGFIATPAGPYATWYETGSSGTWVSHRGSGPDDVWSTPQVLPGSRRTAGTLVGLGREGAVTFQTRYGHQPPHFWRVPSDGAPSARAEVPFPLLEVEAADTVGRRWLVAGTYYQSPPNQKRIAVRGPLGGWRLSDLFPRPFWVDLVGAWFDGDGRAHLLAVHQVTDSRPARSARSVGPDRSAPQSTPRPAGRRIFEATLRPDGSWSEPRTVTRTADFGSAERPQVVVNGDGDVSVLYVTVIGGQDMQALRTRPSGGRWSDPVVLGFPYPSLGIDAAGRTVVAGADGDGDGVQVGRIDPDGTVEGWQELTDATFRNSDLGRLPLTVSGRGSAVLVANGVRTGPGGETSTLRSWRCEPGSPCEPVGDFDGATFYPGLRSTPGGTAYLLFHEPEPCYSDVLCTWRLPDPAE